MSHSEKPSPLISVVMPTFNRSAYIRQAIQSVLSQSEQRFEIIVADDGSTDNTEQIVSQFKDSRIRYFKLPHQGAPQTRNFGLSKVEGEFVFQLDSDDVLLATTFSDLFRTVAAYPEADVYYGNLLVVDKDLNQTDEVRYHDWHNRNHELVSLLMLCNQVPNQALIRSSAFSKVGPFNTDFPRCHDYEWWARAAGILKFKHTDTYTVGWRWHDDNMSATSNEGGVKKQVDTSYEARVVDALLSRYSLRELHPHFDWANNASVVLERECYLNIADTFRKWGDEQSAKKFAKWAADIESSLQSFINHATSRETPQSLDQDSLARVESVRQHATATSVEAERISQSIAPKKSGKKVLVIQSGFPKISSTFILDQITGLIDQGHEVYHWALYDPEEQLRHPSVDAYNLIEKTKYLTVPPQSADMKIDDWVKVFIAKNKIAELDEVDAVHVHFGPTFNKLRPLFALWNVKVIVSFHGYDASKYLKEHAPDVYNYLFSRADVITTPTGVMKERLIALGCGPEKLLIHRYGIDLSKFLPQENVNNPVPRLLTVGRLVEKKGIEFSLRALAMIPRELQYNYRIIGDGPLEQDLRRLAEDLRISDKVTFLGSKTKDEVIDEMNAADVFVLNSVTAEDGDEEGLPVSIIEAQAMKLPVVSSFHAGIAELVSTGQTGLLAEERDVATLATHLSQLIKNQTLRQSMSQQARQKVERDFNIKVLNKRLANCLLESNTASKEQLAILEGKVSDAGWGAERLERYKQSFESVEWLNQVPNPTSSIIVISWRLCSEMEENFKLLQEQRDSGYELIFVDNGGAPGEFDSVKPYIDTYIRLSIDTGAYVARNIGSLFARSNILVFLDDDALPNKDFVNAHLRQFERYDVIAVRGAVIPATDSPLNQLAKHYHLGPEPFPVFCDTECNASYDKAAFYKVGGWDDDIRFGGGGAELSLRLIREYPDYRQQMYSPEPVIHHEYAHNDEHLNTKRIRQQQSRERLRAKYPEWDIYLASWDLYQGRNDMLIEK